MNEQQREDADRRIVLLLMHVWWGWGFDLRDGLVFRHAGEWQRMYGEPPALLVSGGSNQPREEA